MEVIDLKNWVREEASELLRDGRIDHFIQFDMEFFQFQNDGKIDEIKLMKYAIENTVDKPVNLMSDTIVEEGAGKVYLDFTPFPGHYMTEGRFQQGRFRYEVGYDNGDIVVDYNNFNEAYMDFLVRVEINKRKAIQILNMDELRKNIQEERECKERECEERCYEKNAVFQDILYEAERGKISWGDAWEQMKEEFRGDIKRELVDEMEQKEWGGK